MLAGYASNAILAKSRAKFGAGLTKENYRELVGMRTVTDVAAYLKTRTRYKAVLEGVQESDIHRDGLERLLEGYFLREVNDVCRFERSVGEHMFECLIRRVEINELMCFVRYLNAGHPKDYILSLSHAVNYHSNFNLAALSDVSSYDGLLKFLSGNELYRVFANFKPMPGETVDYTMLETALAKYLFSFEMQVVNRHFHGDTRKELMALFSQSAELDNLRRIIRAKRYFSGSADVLRSMLTEVHAMISPRVLEQMLQARDADEVIALLKKTGYRRDLEQLPYHSIDDFANRVLWRRCRKRIRMSTRPAVTMFCYIKLTELEVDNIINIIEGVRYQMSPEAISKLLVPGTEPKAAEA